MTGHRQNHAHSGPGGIYGRPARSASGAVGLANGKNPIGIIVPCHRVVGASGDLTGYGAGLDRKKRLLNFESGATLF